MALAAGWLMVTSTPDYTRSFGFSSRALQEGRSGTIEELHERGLLPTKFIRYRQRCAAG